MNEALADLELETALADDPALRLFTRRRLKYYFLYSGSPLTAEFSAIISPMSSQRSLTRVQRRSTPQLQGAHQCDTSLVSDEGGAALE